MQGKHFCCSSRFLCPNLHDFYYHCSFHLAFSRTIQSTSLHLFLYLCSLQMGHFLRMLPSSSSSHVSKNVLFISLILSFDLLFISTRNQCKQGKTHLAPISAPLTYSFEFQTILHGFDCVLVPCYSLVHIWIEKVRSSFINYFCLYMFT